MTIDNRIQKLEREVAERAEKMAQIRATILGALLLNNICSVADAKQYAYASVEAERTEWYALEEALESLGGTWRKTEKNREYLEEWYTILDKYDN